MTKELLQEESLHLQRIKWEQKMTAKRIERFEPPMWEDIGEDQYDFKFFINNVCYSFTVSRYLWGHLREIVIKKDSRILFDKPATKENYIKACEIVRDLFSTSKPAKIM